MQKQLLVATRKGLFTLAQTTPVNWTISQRHFLGDPVTLAFHDPRSGSTFAALNHGHFGIKLHRRIKEDEAWQEIPTPAYPKFPEGREPDINPMSGNEIPWKTELIWALAAGGEDQPRRIWCGTIPGGLFKSDDNGDSWEIVESLWNCPERKKWFGGGYDHPGIHSICVDPRNSQHIIIGISCGGVWESHDDGETWAVIGQGQRAEYLPPELAEDPVTQDPHYLVQCPGHPECFWIQHHNGIFRSTNGAKTFEEIQNARPSNFGFAVAVHPQNPDTAWFAPAQKDEHRIPVDGKLVITRTRNGGQSFESLSNGLPQEDAYDLIYRHALAIDSSGRQLAFGSTTGNLWISADQGDHWNLFSSNLPPINSVSFI